MLNSYKRIGITKEFIENYQGNTKEDRAFMRKINRKYTSRYNAAKKNATSLSAFMCIPFMLASIKYKLSQRSTLLLLGFLPILVYSSGRIYTYIDFRLCCDEYSKEIITSGLPLADIFCHTLNGDNSSIKPR